MRRQQPSLGDGKILEDHLRGLSYTCGTESYSKNDQKRLAHAISLWLLVLSDLAPSYGLERCFSLANLARWPDQPVIHVDVFISNLKTVLEAIRLYDPNQGRPGFKAYKAYILDNVPDWTYIEIIKPFIYRIYYDGHTAMRDVNTITQFLTRLTLNDVTWVEDSALDEYFLLEESMSHWHYPSTTLDCLRYILNEWMRDFQLGSSTPSFSNGATAEVRRGSGIAEKAKLARLTPELLAADAMISFNNPYNFRLDVSYRPTAEGAFVPKGIDRKRFISMEPTANQYYQYALFRDFDSYFRSHSEMHISLEDQELSRSMCLKGSRDGTYSTIDLSSASDTVTWQLVQELFSELPDILRYLRFVRTNYARVGNRIIRLEKYAPMGSSLCFPMECICFALVASYSCHLAGIPQNFRVYGDDIIIDSRAYKQCMQLLTEMNFIPNKDKSFGPETPFKESCGIECYSGFDITPCRLPRRFDIVKLRNGKSPQQLEGSISLANRLYEYGLYKTRRYLIRDILRVYHEVPFSVDPERGLYHPNPGNTHLKMRYNEDLQRPEVLVRVTKTDSRRGNAYIRYTRSLEVMDSKLYTPGPSLDGQVACGLTRNSLRKEWISLWDLV